MTPAPLPIADPAPMDGFLPPSVRVGAEDRNFGVYLHVPYCQVRCGYCDYNTYTSDEVRGVKRSDFAGQAITEIALAGRVLQEAGLPHRPASTVFFGGGTPTILPSSDLTAMLSAVRSTWGFIPDAEITTEANPDSVDSQYLHELKATGFTRVSFGMQSAVPHVLATLERTHDPERVPLVVSWARQAGLDVSIDLIFNTPGETIDDWRISLEAAIAQKPDHVSAYSLIVEKGTKLARQIRRGEVAAPDDDLAAEQYELADRLLGEAGYDWYEVANWALRDGHVANSSGHARDHRSLHNLAYWQGHDWWGVGPGAHSHVGGVRWWNVKHPAVYAERILAGQSPGAGRETLDDATRHFERVMLATRVREGLPTSELSIEGRTAVAGLIADGLVNAKAALRGQVVLTLQGRLLADAVVRALLP